MGTVFLGYPFGDSALGTAGWGRQVGDGGTAPVPPPEAPPGHPSTLFSGEAPCGHGPPPSPSPQNLVVPVPRSHPAPGGPGDPNHPPAPPEPLGTGDTPGNLSPRTGPSTLVLSRGAGSPPYPGTPPPSRCRGPTAGSCPPRCPPGTPGPSLPLPDWVPPACPRPSGWLRDPRGSPPHFASPQEGTEGFEAGRGRRGPQSSGAHPRAPAMPKSQRIFAPRCPGRGSLRTSATPKLGGGGSAPCPPPGPRRGVRLRAGGTGEVGDPPGPFSCHPQ